MTIYTRSAAAASCLVLATALAGNAFAGDDDKRDKRHKGDEARVSVETDSKVSAARKESQISTTFALNRQLRSSDIDVKVEENTATLSGTVSDEVHKDLAESLAMNADGIDEVDNQIEVDEEYTAEVRADGDRSFGDRVDDAVLTASVKGKLLWSRDAEALNTNVTTEAGVVTLSGVATTEEAKQSAEELASNTDGVRSVVNEIEVDADFHEDAGATSLAQAGASGTVSSGAPIVDQTVQANEPEQEDSLTNEVSDTWITTKVKASLMTSRWVSAFDIDVDVDEGVVKLSGEVNNDDEKELAIDLAENIRGVRNVDASGLTIS
ncbi:MAG: BON domain-containing protein [Gammaproteobacteria bacterium]